MLRHRFPDYDLEQHAPVQVVSIARFEKSGLYGTELLSRLDELASVDQGLRHKEVNLVRLFDVASRRKQERSVD